MSDSLSIHIGRFHNFNKEIKEKAQSEVLEPRVRAAYAEIGAKFSRLLSELDYLIEIEKRS